MEYRSPLGYNFKLEQSLSASKEEESKETPRKDDFIKTDDRRSRKFYDSDKRRNSDFRYSCSPAQQRHSSHWKSPRACPNEPVPVEQLYHPSMLENPWEELERNLSISEKD